MKKQCTRTASPVASAIAGTLGRSSACAECAVKIAVAAAAAEKSWRRSRSVCCLSLLPSQLPLDRHTGNTACLLGARGVHAELPTTSSETMKCLIAQGNNTCRQERTRAQESSRVKFDLKLLSSEFALKYEMLLSIED